MIKKLPPLTPRLRLIADFVRPGGLIADIGTDHAYVPVYLVCSGKNPDAIAIDINKGPLKRAAKTVSDYGVSENVTLILSNGLDAVSHADDIVIAGMGGELILTIINRTQWVFDNRVRLVLQAMTAVEELRLFLCRSGFRIIREAVAREGDKLYVVTAAEYNGEIFEPEPVFLYAGTLVQTGGQLEKLYLLRQAARLKKKAEGLRKSRYRTDEADKIENLAFKITELSTKMRGDVK